MGEGQSKTNSTKNVQGSKPLYRNIDKAELDVCIQSIRYTAELQQGRRKGECTRKEKELVSKIALPKKERDKSAEFEKGRSICNDLRYVQAYQHIQTYCSILKDHEMEIQLSRGDPTKVEELIPYVESVLWGCQKINLEPVNRFINFLTNAFGMNAVCEMSKGRNVKPEIKACFGSVTPSDEETKIYLLSFCEKYAIDFNAFNEIGHNVGIDPPPNYGGDGSGSGSGYSSGGGSTNFPQTIPMIPGNQAFNVGNDQAYNMGNNPGFNPMMMNQGYNQGYNQPGMNQGVNPTNQNQQPPQQFTMGLPYQQWGQPNMVGNTPQIVGNNSPNMYGLNSPHTLDYTGQQIGYNTGPNQNMDGDPNKENINVENKQFTPYPNFNNIGLLKAKDINSVNDSSNAPMSKSIEEFNLRMKNIKESL